jgi:hypothetical protein
MSCPLWVIRKVFNQQDPSFLKMTATVVFSIFFAGQGLS